MNEKNMIQLDNDGSPSIDHFFFSCLQTEILIKKANDSDESGTGSFDALLPLKTDWIDEKINLLKEKVGDFQSINELKFSNLHDFNVGFISLVSSLFEEGKSAISAADRETAQKFASEFTKHCFPKLTASSKDLVEKFIFWTLKDSDIKDDVVGDRPPVGRFMPSRYGNKSGPSRSGGKPQGRGDRGPKSDERRPRKDFDRPRRKEVSDADLLKEILIMSKKLNEDSSLEFVALKPQNSFNRRRQHHLVESEGFSSESRGSENDRHVVIVRK